MANIVKRIFTGNGTMTIPAGVISVNVVAQRNSRGLQYCNIGFVDPFGNAYALGANSHGQLGVGDVTPRSSPTLVAGALKFSQMGYGQSSGSIGTGSSLGLTTSGALYGWGFNSSGVCGLGDVTPRSSPVAVVGGLTLVNADQMQAVASAWGYTASGVLYMWGINANGQLGLGDVTPRSSPVLVAGGLNFKKVVSTAGPSVTGLTTSGSAYSWGAGTGATGSGVLGVGDTTPRSSPVAVVGGLTFSDIAVGAVSVIGLTPSGQVYGWGANVAGQLGDGTSLNRSSPVLVVGGLTFSQIISNSINGSTVVAFGGIANSGKLYMWGDNSFCQLGDNTNVGARSSPVAVVGNLTFQKVQINFESVFGLATDGNLYAWGSNANGQLGDGTITTRSSPVLVAGGLKWLDFSSYVTANTSVSVTGISSTGQIYSWGQNFDGELGDGTTTARSSPVLVVGSLVANSAPTLAQATVSVAPGSTYAISFGPTFSSFGSYVVGGPGTDSLTVSYIQ